MLNILINFRFPKAPMRPQTAATFVARLAVNQSPIAEAALTTAALKSRRKKIERTFRGKRKSKRYIMSFNFDNNGDLIKQAKTKIRCLGCREIKKNENNK